MSSVYCREHDNNMRDYSDMTQLGALIRHHRKRAKLSRKELAQLAGTGQTVLYELEHGKDTVRFDVLMKVMGVLNMELKPVGPFVDEFEGGSQ